MVLPDNTYNSDRWKQRFSTILQLAIVFVLFYVRRDKCFWTSKANVETDSEDKEWGSFIFKFFYFGDSVVQMQIENLFRLYYQQKQSNTVCIQQSLNM